MTSAPPLLTFSSVDPTKTRGDYFATVIVLEEGGGFSTQWVVSHRDVVGVQILGVLNLPIYGFTKIDALKRVGFISGDVIKFVTSVAGGLGSPITAGLDEQHVREHLKYFAPQFEDLPKTERTAILYELVSQFRVHAPAVILAQFEGLASARTIHDRLSQARKQGLL